MTDDDARTTPDASGAAQREVHIAIVGMACVFPQASDLQAFWRNIVEGVDAIGEPPPQWEAERYLSSNRIKTPSGGYLKDLFRFDPREFGVMPSSLDGGEPDQFLALRVARDALRDSGYLRQDYDHTDTGIVLGHSTYLHRGQGTLIQNHIVLDQTLDVLRTMCPQLGDDALQQVRDVLARTLPPSTPDVAPGLVPNVMTGRIANRLNLKGPNYLIDAACSSSLLAVAAAIDELCAGRSRLMLAGGVNASLPAEVSVIFTQLGALSGRGKVRPFEKGSDGTLLGEGLGVVALKRLDDALEDGDRVYAVVRGVGQASDGRGQGLLAPSVEGETLAIRRAYEHTGIDPASIGMIEAHGTGIPLGDKTEITSLSNVFGGRGGSVGSLALGSVKSMISHCIPAAGIAGLIKTALSLHHKVLPPTLCDEVNPELGIKAPLYVNTQTAPWISVSQQPRRAGINSFGFGGINTHAIVEEAPARARKPEQFMPWPAELCVLSANDKGALIAELETLAQRLEQHPAWTLSEIAAALAAADGGGCHRLALVAKDRPALSSKVAQAIKRLRSNDAERWATRAGIVYSGKPLGGELAFLFPGEGSQYPGMFADLALIFGEIRHWLDFWCGLYDEPPGDRRTDILFPPASDLTPERRKDLEERLHDMDVGSEAVFIGGQAMNALLRSLGVRPDVMLGHSSGESSALAASGAIAASDSAQLGEFIRELNRVYRGVLDDGKIPTGALLTVGAMRLTDVEQHIAKVARDVVVAMYNCDNQLVLYGSPRTIGALQESLTDAGAICMLLPFDRGYHTKAFADVGNAFLGYYHRVGLTRPKLPLYSCASTERFPEGDEQIRELAAAQWSNQVRFRETIERMYADGVRTFVEVGPSGNLTAFVNDILAGREYHALATNQRRRGGVEQLLGTIGQLYVEAHPLQLARLFESRAIDAIDLSAEPAAKSHGMVLDNTMPKIRLDDGQREALRAIAAQASAQAPSAAPPSVAATPSPPTQAETSSARPVAAPAPMAADPVPSSEPPPAPQLGDAGAEQVMADYFGLMRTFLEQQPRVLQALQALEGGEWSRAQMPSTSRSGFLDSIIEQSDQHVVASCRLSASEDEFLRHHVLSGAVSQHDPELAGLACAPLMVSLEIMAQACALLAGDATLHVIENVTAFDWIALDDGLLDLHVQAQLTDAERGVYSARLESPSGTAVTADFCFRPQAPQCEPLLPLREYRTSRWNDEGLYESGMFHGPLFQSIRHIDGWDDDGIEAQLSELSLQSFFREGEQPNLVLNPVLLDAMGQLTAYWIAQYAGTDFNCFPSTIERIELHAQCPQQVQGVRLQARQRPLDPSMTEPSAPRAWDFECVDGQGQPLVRVSNLVNIFFGVPHGFYQVRRDPLGGWLGRPADLPRPEGVSLWEVPMFSDDFCVQSGGIFLRILAHAVLSAEERDEWRALTGGPRRRREWLLGRVCIKEAVRAWVQQQTGELLYPSDVIVAHDELGAPFVDGWWRGDLTEAPEVSLSHDARACLAAVAEPVRRVGVDREEIGRVQRPELVIESLTPNEQATLRGLDEASLQDRLLRIWCAKEAAAKMLGLGLQGAPSSFEVQFADAECRSAFVDHGDTPVHVDLLREQTSIIALASELPRETT